MGHLLRAFAVLLIGATAGWTQTTSGSMSGTVIDAQKQVVPGADVTVTNEQNGETGRGVTNDVGSFTFAGLPPGPYTVRADLTGFRPITSRGNMVLANSRLAVPPLVLQVGALSEAVTVSAMGEAVATTTTSHQAVLDLSQVENLSIRGRDPISLLKILPGVSLQNNDQELFGGRFATGVPDVQGGRGQTLYVDGVNGGDGGSRVRYLFSPSNIGLFEIFARSNVLLALDYDGTLAPLVREPERAGMSRTTRLLLKRASSLYPCIVISGRARADVSARLRGTDVGRVVGNHGAEPSPDGQAIRRRVEQWLPTLEQRLSWRQGIVIEDKQFSVAVHYRRARQRETARRAIVNAARSLNNVRITAGKLVVNLVVAHARHKGSALEHERAHFARDTAIYVGDDDTDEDVFNLHDAACLSIRVGRKRTSAAQYYRRNQVEIDRLLQALVLLRDNHSGRT